ncbi:DUF3578 domain-containing protein [Acinetobacter johnsonii]|uniref:MrcB family domain-containing protein n=1 Tax=Acinetobacter johnsonii TaxID=40214 RepID=UPI00309B70AC
MKTDLINVLDSYLFAKQQPYSTNKQQDHYYSLSKGISKTLNDWLQKYADPDLNYLVDWSHGTGKWAEIPWIICTNTAITSSAQRGYYIGILFSADMQSCYMGLLQGVTETSQQDLTNFATLAIEYTGTNPNIENLHIGRIELNGTTKLSKGYQKYAIKSFKYSKDFLKSIDDSYIEKQFEILIHDYESLYSNASNDITNLAPISNDSYQKLIQNIDDETDNSVLVEKPEAMPDIILSQANRFKRSQDKSKKALKQAGYMCEVDSSHITFLTNKNRSYVEGHHFIPMSQQINFSVSLDVTSNIVALCPNCHKALHYGNKDAVKDKIKILFSLREERLKQQGINTTLKDLTKIYTKLGLDQFYD